MGIAILATVTASLSPRHTLPKIPKNLKKTVNSALTNVDFSQSWLCSTKAICARWKKCFSNSRLSCPRGNICTYSAVGFKIASLSAALGIFVGIKMPSRVKLCYQKDSQSVGFEPTLPEGIWFLVRRLNRSACFSYQIAINILFLSEQSLHWLTLDLSFFVSSFYSFSEGYYDRINPVSAMQYWTIFFTWAVILFLNNECASPIKVRDW